MPSYQGVCCQVFVDGEETPEYNVDVLDENTCEFYIEAVENAEYGYALHFNFSPYQVHYFRFAADGRKLFDTKTCMREYQNDCAPVKRPDGRQEYRKLKFGKLETVLVDEKSDATENRKDVLQNLGTLEWKVWRGFRTVPGPSQPKSSPSKAPKNVNQSLKPVYEKDIKGQACSHFTELGDVGLCPPREPSFTAGRFDPYANPYVIFRCHYVSRAILEAKGLILRTPSPVNLDADLADMTADQMQREIMRLRNQSFLPNIKAEDMDDCKVKTEDYDDKENLVHVIEDEENGRNRKKRKIEVTSLSDDDD